MSYPPEGVNSPSPISWPGDRLRPQSMNGWNYVENNPLNLIDPTGQFPEYCRTALTPIGYEHCVRSHFRLEPINDAGDTAPQESRILGFPGCYYGEIPYRAEGYMEGLSGSVAGIAGFTGGREVVYDFATMERQNFNYFGGVLFSDTLLGGGGTNYVGVIRGFRSWYPQRNIVRDYEGRSDAAAFSAGYDPGLFGITGGGIIFAGYPDTSIWGVAYAVNGSASISIPVLDFAFTTVYYVEDDSKIVIYFDEYYQEQYPRRQVTPQHEINLLDDIRTGANSPGALAEESSIAAIVRTTIQTAAKEWIRVYNEIHYHSYPKALQ